MIDKLKDKKETIKNSYGVNKEIVGSYDTSLSVKLLNGIYVGKKNGDVIEYKGIPFAKPPIGKLRWKRAEKVDESDKVYEAYNNGKSCIQTLISSELSSFYEQGEDCLYLNMWTNSSCKDTNKQIMVFIHGGSYGWGGTADPIYDGNAFVRKHPDVILITIAYRIGLMGFMDFSLVPGGEEYADACNLGILDQIEALKYIKSNALSIGGNPETITVFGESAGGGSVSILPIIDEAKGLFKRVIAESGSVALTYSKEECLPLTEMLMKAANAKNMDDLIHLSEDEIKVINKKLNDYNNFPQRDGRIIPIDVYGEYEKGKTKDIDMLIGTNANELNYWIGEAGGFINYSIVTPIKFENDLMKYIPKSNIKSLKKSSSIIKGRKIWKITEIYNELMFRLPAISQCDGHSNNGGNTYLYYWKIWSKIKRYRACHAVELAYVFGNINETIYTGEPISEEVSNEVMNMWVNFAKTGNPSTEKTKWDSYKSKTKDCLVISDDFHMESDILKEQRILLSPYVKCMVNASYFNLNFNVPFVRKNIYALIALLLVIVGIVLFIVLKE